MDFENGFVNDWTQLENDHFDFTLQQGKTETVDTGPATDHTYQEEHGRNEWSLFISLCLSTSTVVSL